MMNHYIVYCLPHTHIVYFYCLFLDYLDPVQQAPFDIDQDYVKMQTNEERIKVS